MRKTFGYFLYKQGTKTDIIQSLLNHSSQRETLRYIGITQEDKDTAVKSLDLWQTNALYKTNALYNRRKNSRGEKMNEEK